MRSRQPPLNMLYPLPDICHESGCLRLLHRDLCALDTAQLRQEGRRIRYRLDLAERPDPWLWERLDRLRAEIARRQREDRC